MRLGDGRQGDATGGVAGGRQVLSRDPSTEAREVASEQSRQRDTREAGDRDSQWIVRRASPLASIHRIHHRIVSFEPKHSPFDVLELDIDFGILVTTPWRRDAQHSHPSMPPTRRFPSRPRP